jgi:AraC-like DNA-binding protein
MAVQLIDNGTDITEEHRRLVERITCVMRFTDEPMTIGDLAETAGLSPFYFTRIFRQYAGIPPGEFQAALRFEKAKHLLLHSPASITEICFEVGYGSLGTFSARFKHLVGVSPAEFRNLPEIVCGMDMSNEVNPSFTGKPGPCAEVHGTINRPEGHSSSVFIGIYPDYIAASRPVKGMMVPDAPTFVLPEIPRGTWRVLAASVPRTSDPLVHLLPMSHALVATGGLVTVRTGTERFDVTLNLHPPIPTMPPVLTALPALLL